MHSPAWRLTFSGASMRAYDATNFAVTSIGRRHDDVQLALLDVTSIDGADVTPRATKRPRFATVR